MEKREGGRNGGDGQQHESLVFSFPGYKTPTQPVVTFNEPTQQQMNLPSQLYSSSERQSSAENPINALLIAGDFRATPDRPIAAPTLGQIASRIKEKASASRRQSSEEMDVVGDDFDGGDDDDVGDDGEEEGGGGQDQSTGRWTKKEHELFLAALKKYGKVSTVLFLIFFVRLYIDISFVFA